MAEERIYADDRISISTARVVVGGTTYALRNITSVRLGSTAPSRRAPIACLVMAFIVVFFGYAIFPEAKGMGVAFSLAGIALAVAALYALFRAAPLYTVTVASSSGEGRVLTSADKLYVTKIVESINDAIVRQS